MADGLNFKQERHQFQHTVNGGMLYPGHDNLVVFNCTG